jgi:hypothetical protein
VVTDAWVVPYNRALLLKYRCHLNVEVCSTLHAVKYLHKYIHKGGDRAEGRLEPDYAPGETEALDAHAGVQPLPKPPKDEIGEYLVGRYISTSEACWRFMMFPLHHNEPAVFRLLCHLPGQHMVTFDETSDLQEVTQVKQDTMLTAWLDYNRTHTDGRHLTYANFPSQFTFSPLSASNPGWHRRTGPGSIGRVYFVSPLAGQKYYLRLLLHHVKGAGSWDELLLVDGVPAADFQDACMRRGLLQDDREWVRCLEEAGGVGGAMLPWQLRILFTIILFFNRPRKPLDLCLLFYFHSCFPFFSPRFVL